MNLAAPASPANVKMRRALNNSLKYNLTTWFTACFGNQTGPIKPNGTSQYPIRLQATVAYAAAIALKTNAYNPSVVGLPTAEATKRAIQLTVGIAMSHLTNTASGGWGHDWQSAYWAFMAGTSGWLLYPNMTVPERQATARMVASEADYQMSRLTTNGVRYYADRSGHILTPGNTGAEEDAWDSTVLGLAAMMLPHDSRVVAWRHLEAQLQIAAFSRPADLSNNQVVNGQAVTSWLGGTNIFDDGTLVNHNHLSPEYMVTDSLNLDGVLTPGLDGKPGLNTALWNATLVYGALSTKSFAAPPNFGPGGHIYRTKSHQIYYPQGDDWGDVQMTPYVTFDALASSLSFGQQFSSNTWLGLHLDQELKLQSRFSDGRTFAGTSTQKGSENRYPGREQVATGQLAQAWLSQYLGAHHLLATTNAGV